MVLWTVQSWREVQCAIRLHQCQWQSMMHVGVYTSEGELHSAQYPLDA